MSDNTSPPEPPTPVPEQHQEQEVPVVSPENRSSSSTEDTDTDSIQEVPDQLWKQYFPFDPYEAQHDGVNRALNMLSQGGYLTLEGACGTGKTLIAVIAGVTAMRHGDTLSDVFNTDPAVSKLFVATPLKSQLTQFVTEAKTINKHLSDDTDAVTAAVLRGKQDLLPYVVAEQLPDELVDESAHDVMTTVTQNTAKLFEPGGPPLYHTPGTAPEKFPVYAGHQSGFSFGDETEKLPDTVGPTASSVSHIRGDGVALDQSRKKIPDGENGFITFSIDPRRVYGGLKTLKKATEIQDGITQLTVEGTETPYPKEMPHGYRLIDIYRLAEQADEYNPASIHTTVKENFHDAVDDENVATPVDSFDALPCFYHIDYLNDQTVSKLIGDTYDAYIDPFYAKSEAVLATYTRHLSLNQADNGVFSRDVFIQEAASKGICPYQAFINTIETHDLDLYLGNYYHVFDPKTRRLTTKRTDILSETTGLVLDEAHQLVPRVRDIFSTSIGYTTIRDAVGDIDALRDIVAQDDTAKTIEDYTRHSQKDTIEPADAPMGLPELTDNQLKTARHLLTTLQDAFLEETTDRIQADSTLSSWKQWKETADPAEVPLEPPSEPAFDALSSRLTATDELAESIGDFPSIANAIEEIYSLDPNASRSPSIDAVGNLVSEWFSQNHTDYFRYVKLEPNNRTSAPEGNAPWMEAWEPRLTLYNTLPSRKLAQIFASCAGGVVMSATLTPTDIYQQTSGLHIFEQNTERPVADVQYPLNFPEKNRSSLVVPHDEFTRSNRGSPRVTSDEMSTTRQNYAATIKEIANSYGNVLLALPNYREAKWAATILERAEPVTKSILRDRSSTATKTNDLLEQFFDDDEHKILLTSARGTVTEGIDYDGDKLHTVAVFGVPYPPSNVPTVQATMAAYEDTFSDLSYNAYELVLGIPTVRKVRQAIGRVIRSPSERGVRLLVDDRYTPGGYRSVAEHLSTEEQREFTKVQPSRLREALTTFWTHQ
jgi:DNA excision repair protein ERCC-2